MVELSGVNKLGIRLTDTTLTTITVSQTPDLNLLTQSDLLIYLLSLFIRKNYSLKLK